jgi:hypothetical protein
MEQAFHRRGWQPGPQENSVTVLDNGDILVLTTTDGYSENGAEEVWTIKGRLKD